MNNRCVCCGEIIPEGRQVCPNCESKVKKIYSQKRLGDIRGIAVFKCESCGSRTYGTGSYCRLCGVKLKELQNESN